MISRHRLPLLIVFVVMCLALAGPTAAQEGKKTAELLKQALDGPSVDRQRAALVLVSELNLKGADAAAAARYLEQYLARTSDDESLALGLIAYGKLAPPMEKAAKVLKAGFEDPSPRVRQAAGQCLVDLVWAEVRPYTPAAPPGPFTKPPVVPTTSNAASAVAGTMPFVVATREWGRYSEDVRGLLPFCAVALKDPDDRVKASGAEGIRQIARALADVIPDPATSVADTKVIDPLEAKWKWLLLQPVFETIDLNVGGLKGAMLSERLETRKTATSAADAVAQVRSLALASRRAPPDNITTIVATPPPEDALKNVAADLLPPLAARLTDESPEIRLMAIEGFEHQGEAARPFLSAIINASTNADTFVRWVATRTLGRQFASATDADALRIVRALETRIHDTDIDVRSVALTAVGKGGNRARSATDDVLTLVAAGDPDQRVLAIRTLGLIDADRNLSVPVLAEALQARSSAVRKAAVVYLGVLGHDARPVVSRIKPLLFDANDEVKKETAQALLAIE